MRNKTLSTGQNREISLNINLRRRIARLARACIPVWASSSHLRPILASAFARSALRINDCRRVVAVESVVISLLLREWLECLAAGHLTEFQVECLVGEAASVAVDLARDGLVESPLLTDRIRRVLPRFARCRSAKLLGVSRESQLSLKMSAQSARSATSACPA